MSARLPGCIALSELSSHPLPDLLGEERVTSFEGSERLPGLAVEVALRRLVVRRTTRAL